MYPYYAIRGELGVSNFRKGTKGREFRENLGKRVARGHLFLKQGERFFFLSK
jgi:hypothetical protein